MICGLGLAERIFTGAYIPYKINGSTEPLLYDDSLHVERAKEISERAVRLFWLSDPFERPCVESYLVEEGFEEPIARQPFGDNT